MASPDQITALRRAVNIVARQAPTGSIDASWGLFEACNDPELADRLLDALHAEGISDAVYQRGYHRGYDHGYDAGFNAGLGITDYPTNPTSEEDTNNEQ